MFSCEFCKISKNTFLTEHLWATTSGYMGRILLFNKLPMEKVFAIDIVCIAWDSLFSVSNNDYNYQIYFTILFENKFSQNH